MLLQPTLLVFGNLVFLFPCHLLRNTSWACVKCLVKEVWGGTQKRDRLHTTNKPPGFHLVSQQDRLLTHQNVHGREELDFTWAGGHRAVLDATWTLGVGGGEQVWETSEEHVSDSPSLEIRKRSKFGSHPQGKYLSSPCLWTPPGLAYLRPKEKDVLVGHFLFHGLRQWHS